MSEKVYLEDHENEKPREDWAVPYLEALAVEFPGWELRAKFFEFNAPYAFSIAKGEGADRRRHAIRVPALPRTSEVVEAFVGWMEEQARAA